MSDLSHRVEAAALRLLYGALRLLPLNAASWLGGRVARSVGPFFSAQKIAHKNLAAVFPEKSAQERDRIIAGMWDNLGRVGAELSHLHTDELLTRLHIDGLEHMPEPGKNAFFFSGHFGNWELLPATATVFGRVPLSLIYREANNPYFDKIITDIRATRADGIIQKGRAGAVKIARAIKSRQSIAMLVDQKMNDGIAVPFFGRDAMTAPAIAQLALRYDIAIVPARILRTKGAHFHATIFPPLAFEKTGDAEKDTLAMMTVINATLEGWIRDYPEQWFWVHRRWPNA
jgi:KDO2-lipid IV(A) lauroyltransferase